MYPARRASKPWSTTTTSTGQTYTLTCCIHRLILHWIRYHVLHYTYNFAKHTVMSPTRFDIYVDRYIDTVKVVHYLGVKPWMCSRDRDCMRHVAYYSGNSNMYLYDLWVLQPDLFCYSLLWRRNGKTRWWTMLEEMCDLQGVICQSWSSEIVEEQSEENTLLILAPPVNILYHTWTHIYWLNLPEIW